MPLTLTQFLLSIPISVAVLFAPFVLVAIWKRRPLRHILLTYVSTSVVLILVLWLWVLLENS